MSRRVTAVRTVSVVLLAVVAAGTGVASPVLADGGRVADGVAPGARQVPDGPPALAAAAADGQESPFTGQATVEGFDRVEVVVYVGADLSAEWRVVYRYRLADEASQDAFDRARRNVSNPPGVFIERMREAARRSRRQTGREMAVGNGTVSAYTSAPHGRFGLVEYRFTWRGFAAERDGRVVAGDVLDGYPLGENESLAFGWGEAFDLAEASPEPDATAASSVRWEGPHEFSVGNPRLAMTRTGAGGRSLADPLVVAALGGALAVLAGAAVAGRALDRPLPLPGRDEPATDESADPPPELLSDEERVLGLLEDNGGRMKQQAVKDQLDWSRTKTSNVVNDLADEGRIEVYRLGRENTLALPGEMDL